MNKKQTEELSKREKAILKFIEKPPRISLIKCILKAKEICYDLKNVTIYG